MKYAVVTGANKGIGYEICRQLARSGVTVVLTARDEKKGLEAVEKLKRSDDQISDKVLFHRLDVMDPSSFAPLADFIKNHLGKLDILVNNAGVSGFHANVIDTEGASARVDFNNLTETYDMAVECVETNYYGSKRTTEALLPLLQLSDSPRIVNVSSSTGKLKNIPSEWAKGVLNDAENLTEARIDQVVNEFLKDFKEGSLEAKAWPRSERAYKVSKAAVSAYTRLLAKKYPSFRVNCVCPGYTKTDINYNTGVFSVEESAEGPVKLALLQDDGPSGLFFFRKEVSSFEE